jgi:hypothetical protein
MSSPLCSLHWLHLKAAASEALPLSFFKNQGYYFSRPVPTEELRQLLLESAHGSILSTQRVETLSLSS